MELNRNILLLIDAVVNLILGLFLLLFPVGVIQLFGLPQTNTHFYTSILGAVLFGIGIALLLEVPGPQKPDGGLGLKGAIAINFCGSIVLMLWLVFGSLEISLIGRIILWVVGLAVFFIGVAEWYATFGRPRGQG